MLIKYLKIIKNFLRNFIINQIYIKTNSKFYYEATLDDSKRKFIGSFNFFRILILNILFPGRSLYRFKYSQLINKNQSSIQKTFDKNLKIFVNNYNHYFNNEKIFKLKKYLEILSNDGAILIENYFSDNSIEKIKFQYQDIISKEKLLMHEDSINSIDSTARYSWYICKFDNQLKNFWYDPGIILLLESYFQSVLYARNYPFLLNTFVPKSYTQKSKSKTANIYHVDHCLLATLYVFLDDVRKDGTCLEVVKGSHRYLNTGWPFSEESVAKKEKKKMTGKKGSVHIHLGNTVHKAHLASGTNRLSLMFEYSLGGNILFDLNNLFQSYSVNFNIDELNSKERNFFRGIYPKSLPKGYEILKNNGLISNTYKDL